MQYKIEVPYDSESPTNRALMKMDESISWECLI